jgi:hypothetical protein
MDVTPETLAAWLGRPVRAVRAEDMSKAGGLRAKMQRLHVEFGDGSGDETLVLKTAKSENAASNAVFGSAREALFYATLAPRVAAAGVQLPRVLHAHGDLTTGLATILMEDLADAVLAGHLFGPGSPLKSVPQSVK